jgi:hypothetical protein
MSLLFFYENEIEVNFYFQQILKIEYFFNERQDWFREKENPISSFLLSFA